MISAFDIFSIGIGPSSSHTVGPMRAAAAFVDELVAGGLLGEVVTLTVRLHGALAATGRGHGTVEAVMLGLEGNLPEEIDPAVGAGRVQTIARSGRIRLGGRQEVPFSDDCFVFLPAERPGEFANAVTFTAETGPGSVTARWYSIGGGFILREGGRDDEHPPRPVPYPFGSAGDLLRHCENNELTIAEVVWRNEVSLRSVDEVGARLQHIWQIMDEAISRGLQARGELPGGLGVRRRAGDLVARAAREDSPAGGSQFSDRVGAYAMAVNEENAAGGRVVTAPTNGAAGVIPAVLRVALEEWTGPEDAGRVVQQFLLTATAIGSIIKTRASISGADVGCQGEVGSACAMAAAGLAAVLGGSVRQIQNAAEIAMEHHLGMTCDPVGGLVQIPCIERNGMGAVKAVHAARTAILGDGAHRVTLDQVIETMRQTGADMNVRYKETAAGGLAVNVVEC